MKRIFFLLALTCLTLSAQTPKAKVDEGGNVTLRALVGICKSEDVTARTFCETYILGFLDGAKQALAAQSINPVAEEFAHSTQAPVTEEAVGEAIIFEHQDPTVRMRVGRCNAPYPVLEAAGGPFNKRNLCPFEMTVMWRPGIDSRASPFSIVP